MDETLTDDLRAEHSRRLRAAFKGLSQAAFRVRIPGKRHRKLLGDSLHVVHVAIHEAVTVLEALETKARCTCFEWGYGAARCPVHAKTSSGGGPTPSREQPPND